MRKLHILSNRSGVRCNELIHVAVGSGVVPGVAGFGHRTEEKSVGLRRQAALADRVRVGGDCLPAAPSRRRPPSDPWYAGIG